MHEADTQHKPHGWALLSFTVLLLYVHTLKPVCIFFLLLFSPPMCSFDPLWDPPLRTASPNYGGWVPNKKGPFWGLNPPFLGL